VKLRRGFKSEAEAYALEFRQELGIGASHPLCMFKLAKHLHVRTMGLSLLEEQLPVACYVLLTTSVKSPFSAVTLYERSSRCILYNDSHAPQRQQSDIAHELSHIILGHSPSELTTDSGGRHYDKELEDEAACLSGVLLLPKPAAIAVMASRRPIGLAAIDFNISEKMMSMRLHQSGAKKIMARSGY
jgi:Zn-dependent peptidase ImmA (M78 family)